MRARKTMGFVVLWIIAGLGLAMAQQPDTPPGEADAPADRGVDEGAPRLADDPELFDFIRDFVELELTAVAAGQGREALEYIAKNSVDPSLVVAEEKEKAEKALAGIFALYGEHEGYELVGFKRMSSRFCKVFVMDYYEKSPVLWTFTFLKSQGQWKLKNFHMTSTDFDVLEEATPLERFKTAPIE